MKHISLTLGCILFALTTGMAQTDTPQKTINVKAIDSSPKPERTIYFKISPVQGLTNKNVGHRINYNPLPDFTKRTSGVDMTAKSNLVSPSWDIKQKFGEDQKDLSKFSKDYYLGDLRTTSKTIIIKCRDHEYVDGDRIRLMLNNAVIHPNLTLTGDFYTIDIDLNEGYNTINFVALNEGLSSPNTAELKVFDENGKLLGANKWLIRTGYKASLTIFKE